MMASLVQYRTPYEIDPFSCLEALDRVPSKDVIVSFPHSRRQNVDPKIYTKYLRYKTRKEKGYGQQYPKNTMM